MTRMQSRRADGHDSLGVIAVVDEGEDRVMRLGGEIDSLVVAAYEANPFAVVDPARPVDVIDTSAVTFIDGRGLRFLLGRTQVADRVGAQPILRSPARVVRRLLDAAGTTHLFTIRA